MFVSEIEDGTWGAAGYPLTLEPIIDYVAPGLGVLAVNRWEARKREDAAALAGLAVANASA